MRVVPVRVLSDNYAYLLIDEESHEACAVDPAEPDKMISEAVKEGVIITKVLTTHKHLDHAGGNDDIKRKIKGIDIVGGNLDSVAACTKTVEDGDIIIFGSITVRCLLTPGHTRGHICYYASVDDDKISVPCVFTGDCLFIGGAGRFFEGTGTDMYHSLYEKLAKLHGDTLVFCGHEYTAQNYRFARYIDPENIDLETAERDALKMLEVGNMTVPSTIAQEKKTNPFMRAHLSHIKAAVGLMESSSTAESLQAIRDAKNIF